MDKQTVRDEIRKIIEVNRQEIDQWRALFPIKADQTDMEIAAGIWLRRRTNDLERRFAESKEDLNLTYIGIMHDVQREKAEAEYRRKKGS